jgi:hypothetical protein
MPIHGPSTHHAKAMALAALLFLPAAGRAQVTRLIQDVAIPKRSVCVGEEVEVTVRASHPKGATRWVDVAIDGYPGSRRFLRFMGRPGPRLVHVAASSEGGLIESRTETLEVRDCQAPPALLVRARVNPYRPFTADFTVVPTLGSQPGSYRWAFGDGRTQTTRAPYVSHSYADSLDGSKPYATFVVDVSGPARRGAARYAVTLQDNYWHLKRQGIVQPRVTATPTMTRRAGEWVGTYAIRNLEPGALVFDAATTEFQYCDVGRPSRFAAVAPSVDALPPPPAGPNVPAGPTVPAITPRIPSGTVPAMVPHAPGMPAISVTTAPAGPANPTGHVGTAVATTIAGAPLTIAAGARQSRTIRLPDASLPSDVCGIAYHLSGRAATGEKAYASAYFVLRAPPQIARTVADAPLRQLLLALKGRGLIAAETEITHDTLYRLEQEGRIRQTATGWEMTR